MSNSTTFKLPARVDGRPQVSPPGELNAEEVAMYCELLPQSERIVTGCLAFGIEPLPRETTDQGIPYWLTKVLDATAPDEMKGDGITGDDDA